MKSGKNGNEIDVPSGWKECSIVGYGDQPTVSQEPLNQGRLEISFGAGKIIVRPKEDLSKKGSFKAARNAILEVLEEIKKQDSRAEIHFS